VREEIDVRRAFAERWEGDGETGEPVQEVGTQVGATEAGEARLVALITRACNVTSRFEPRRRNVRVSSTRRSLGWIWSGHLGDLVEEHRAPARGLEEAHARGAGAGVCACFVAEELALEEMLRNRRAVERHEGKRGLLAEAMNGVGDQLLAGARLPEDHHGHVAIRGDGADLISHELDGRRATENGVGPVEIERRGKMRGEVREQGVGRLARIGLAAHPARAGAGARDEQDDVVSIDGGPHDRTRVAGVRHARNRPAGAVVDDLQQVVVGRQHDLGRIRLSRDGEGPPGRATTKPTFCTRDASSLTSATRAPRGSREVFLTSAEVEDRVMSPGFGAHASEWRKYRDDEESGASAKEDATEGSGGQAHERCTVRTGDESPTGAPLRERKLSGT